MTVNHIYILVQPSLCVRFHLFKTTLSPRGVTRQSQSVSHVHMLAQGGSGVGILCAATKIFQVHAMDTGLYSS